MPWSNLVPCRVGQDGKLARLVVRVNMGGIGVSLMDSGLEELVYSSASGLRATYTLGSLDRSLEVKIASLQLDNQTAVGPPVLLARDWAAAPQPPAAAAVAGPAGRADPGPTLHVSVVRKSDLTLAWYPYVAVGLQELRLTLHESLLARLLAVAQSAVNASASFTSAEESLHHWFSEVVIGGQGPNEDWTAADGPVVHEDQGGQRVYIEALHLHPVRLHLSFTPTGEIAERHARGSSASGLLGTFKWLNVNLPAIEGASISVNALIMDRPMATAGEIWAFVARHYKRQILRQLYGRFGIADLLATPAAGSGDAGRDTPGPGGGGSALGATVRDVFYPPAEAVVRSPDELGDAAAAGRSLTRAVGDGFAAAGWLSREASRGLAALAVDGPTVHWAGADWAAGPPGAAAGLDAGPGGADVLRRPLQALGSDGIVGGFFQSLGKNLFGGAVKPAANLFDAAARTSDGLAAAAAKAAAVPPPASSATFPAGSSASPMAPLAGGLTSSSTPWASPEFGGRVRPPRQVPADGTLRLYDPFVARGLDVLRRISGGRHSAHLLVCSLSLPPTHLLVCFLSLPLWRQTHGYRGPETLALTSHSSLLSIHGLEFRV